MPSLQTESTPNPNSVKITTSDGVFIQEGMASFDSATEAAGHPLGEELFSIPGVENVFILPDFVTITKSPGANWNHLMRKVKEVLKSHLTD